MTLSTFERAPRRRWRLLRAATLAALAAAAMMLVAPSPASASTPGQAEGAYWLEDYQTDYCLNSGSLGNTWMTNCAPVVVIFNKTTTPWDGWFQFVDPDTGRCLDSNEGGALYTSPCNWNNTYQAWQLGGGGPASTVQDRQTGRCLDSNYAGYVYTSPCNWNNTYENWRVV